jgi:hypothetical protein
MASYISWSNDFFLSATDFEFFYKYLGLTVRILSLRRTSLTYDFGFTVICFLIASLRCYGKVRGFSSGHCCKAKLLFHIDTWHSREQVSEPFWASVSSLEEWGIWSRLNYFISVWEGWSDITLLISLTIFFFIWQCWGIESRALHMLGRHSSTELCPHPQIFFLFPLALLGLELRTLCLQSTLLLVPYHQPLLVWIIKGTACAPVGIGTFFCKFLGATGIGDHCKW